MRGNWCKNCNKFVDIKKDYTRAKIAGIIYLIAIGIGFLAFFPWGGLIVLVIPVFLICFGDLGFAGVFTARHACSVCRRTARRKRIRK